MLSISRGNGKVACILNRSEFEVFTAVTGGEALRVHRDKKVDLIVADLNMPQISGDELCSIIRTEQEFRNVSILLTCRNTPDELERIAKSGANAWLTKPIDSGQFLEKIGQLLAVSIRKDYRVLLKAQVKAEIDSAPFFCTRTNISSSGILIETDKILSRGDRIICTFFLTGARQIVADGETMRCLTLGDNCYRYGIRFIDLIPESRMEIERLVASLA